MSAVLLLAAMTVVAAAPVLDGTKVVEKQFDNGFRLIVKPEHQWGLVSMGLYIRAGSVCETDQEAGTAHLLEHMLFESTDRSDGQRIGPAIEGMGGSINARTTRDFTHLDITVASQYGDEALAMLAQAVFEIEISDAAVAREREIVARELTDRASYAEGSLDDLIWDTAFTAHPYRRGIGGTPEAVARITAAGLTDFHARWYVPANMALIVAGDVEADALTARVEELFGSRPATGFELTIPPAEAPPTEVRTAVKTRPSGTTLLTFAWQAPGIDKKTDVCAMDLIYTILGEGAFGRLYTSLEESGLGLMTSVDYLTQRYPGLVMITVLTTPGNDLQVRGAVLAEVQRLRDEPVTEAQLARAKRLLRVAYAFNNEAYSDQVGTLGFYEAIDTHRFAIDYVDLVNAITVEDITRVAQTYLSLDAYTLVIIRPETRPGETEEAHLRCDDMPPVG